MISRTLEKRLLSSIEQWPVTLITGARQVGKSTLCSKIAKERGYSYVSLDNPIERATAIRDPMMFIKMHPAPIIIDEVQYAPNLFDAIEYDVNRSRTESGSNYGMYILTGSQSYNLMENVTQSLAGRVNILVMSPFSMRETMGLKEVPFTLNGENNNEYSIEPMELYQKIVRGFYPELYDNESKDCEEFYRNYVNTYIERDVSQLINVRDKMAFTEFLSILASFTGEELVYEKIANAVRVSPKTIKSWIGVLETGHIIKLLKPYYDTSLVNRIINHPKIYFNDTGLACFLMGIHDSEVLSKSIFKGRLFETYVVNEIIKSYMNNSKNCDFSYFRDNNGNEIDLLMVRDAKVTMIEIKSGVMFDKSDVSSFKQLKAGSREIVGGCIICNTDSPYPITDGVLAIPVTMI